MEPGLAAAGNQTDARNAKSGTVFDVSDRSAHAELTEAGAGQTLAKTVAAG